jgi:hypothetical protein
MSNRRPTALAAAALVVAVLGWTPLGEAARDAVFPPNSVGPRQLRTNAVTSPKIRNGSVQGIDVQKRTLTNAHIKPGSLLASSFKAGQLPAGPKGDKGEKGDTGENGISKAFTNRVGSPTHPLPAAFAPIVTLPLEKGRYVILGKVWVSGTASNFTAICTTGVGTTTDLGLAATYGGAATTAVSQTLAMHTVVTLSAAATASISCRTPRAGSWAEATLTAIQIG